MLLNTKFDKNILGQSCNFILFSELQWIILFSSIYYIQEMS